MNKGYDNITISVPIDMLEWLDKPENSKINRSRLFQDAVEHIWHPKPRRISPMSLLVILMGFSFGVGCIIGAMSFNFEYLFKVTLYMLGFVVLLASSVTIIKESRIHTRG